MARQRIHRSVDRGIRTTIFLVLGAVYIAGCSTTHASSTTTTAGTKTATNAPGHAVVLTLADSGRKVTLSPGADLTVDLAKQSGSPDRWTLLTSGPGVTETNGGTYGESRKAPPSQQFEFRWNRATPFGMVMVLESPKKTLEPQEFAVTLEPKGYEPTSSK